MGTGRGTVGTQCIANARVSVPGVRRQEYVLVGYQCPERENQSGSGGEWAVHEGPRLRSGEHLALLDEDKEVEGILLSRAHEAFERDGVWLVGDVGDHAFPVEPPAV